MKKLILFELRKVFSKRLALIALIGIILFSALLSFSTFQNKYAFDQNIGEGTGKTAVKIDKEIAAKYEGILTDEKVQQMMSDFAPTHDLHGLNAMYLYQNATQSAAFSRFSDKEGNWNGLSVSDVFGNEEIKIGYTLTSRGQYSILANHLGIFLKRLCQKRRRNIIELLTVVYEHIYHIIRIAKVVEFFQSALNVFGCKHFLPYLSIDFSLFFCHCSKS